MIFTKFDLTHWALVILATLKKKSYVSVCLTYCTSSFVTKKTFTLRDLFLRLLPTDSLHPFPMFYYNIGLLF